MMITIHSRYFLAQKYVMDAHFAVCELRTESLYIMQIKFYIQRIKVVILNSRVFKKNLSVG